MLFIYDYDLKKNVKLKEKYIENNIDIFYI